MSSANIVADLPAEYQELYKKAYDKYAPLVHKLGPMDLLALNQVCVEVIDDRIKDIRRQTAPIGNRAPNNG